MNQPNGVRPAAPRARMHWAEALANLSEEDSIRFKRHKAMLRAAFMQCFAETCSPKDWNHNDDRVMDVAIHWLIGIQPRGGSNVVDAGEEGEASIASAEVKKAAARDLDPSVPGLYGGTGGTANT